MWVCVQLYESSQSMHVLAIHTVSCKQILHNIVYSQWTRGGWRCALHGQLVECIAQWMHCAISVLLSHSHTINEPHGQSFYASVCAELLTSQMVIEKTATLPLKQIAIFIIFDIHNHILLLFVDLLSMAGSWMCIICPINTKNCDPNI